MKKKTGTWQRQRKITGLLFLIPFFAITVIFILIPLFRVIYYSFFNWNGIGKPQYIGLNNYINLPDTEKVSGQWPEPR